MLGGGSDELLNGCEGKEEIANGENRRLSTPMKKKPLYEKHRGTRDSAVTIIYFLPFSFARDKTLLR